MKRLGIKIVEEEAEEEEEEEEAEKEEDGGKFTSYYLISLLQNYLCVVIWLIWPVLAIYIYKYVSLCVCVISCYSGRREVHLA